MFQLGAASPKSDRKCPRAVKRSGAAAAARSGGAVGSAEVGERGAKTETRGGGGATTRVTICDMSEESLDFELPRQIHFGLWPSILRCSTEPHRRNVCTDDTGTVIEPERLAHLRQSVWEPGDTPAKDEQTHMDNWADDVSYNTERRHPFRNGAPKPL